MATAKKTTQKSAADPADQGTKSAADPADQGTKSAADQGTKSSSTPRAAKSSSTSPESTSPVAPKPRRARKSEPAAATPEPAAVASSAAAKTPPTRAPSSRAATSAPTESPSLGVDAPSLDPDHEARLREHAYLLAESNHFAGDPSFYWHVAERELARSGRFDAPSTARLRGAHAETR